MGWKADIFLPLNYPENLLYSRENLLRPFQFFGGSNRLVKLLNHILLILWWLTKFWRYEYHLYYGQPPVVEIFERKLGLTRIFGDSFSIELWLAKLFGVKLIFLPTGCREEESKENFSKLDSGSVCSNCGMYYMCIDNENKLAFSRINRYFELSIGLGSIDSTQYKMTHIRYKSIDLKLWRPNMSIPLEHKLPDTPNIRIMHSAYLAKSGRDWLGRNIKGSPYVLAAIERLKKEGHPVEYFFVHDKPSNQMRFYQAQADIIVEQLIYGWWGSTFVEAAALGKPVVCYLRPAWKEFFLRRFSEYGDLPVVEADINSIYEVLKKLVSDADYRRQMGEDSRKFAEAHFNPENNTKDFIKIMEAI